MKFFSNKSDKIKILLYFVLVLLFSNSYTQNEFIKNNYDSLKFISLFNRKLKDSVSCFRIPAIVKAKNSDLIVAIDERVPSCGDLKWNNDINIVIRQSKDNGNIWSEIKTIIDYPVGESASDPSMIVDNLTGEIFLFFNYMNHNKEKDTYYLKVIKSKDNGLSWSQPEDITSQITKPEWHYNFKFITSGGGIQTNSGKLINTLVNLEKGLYIFYSNNHGNSWNLIDNAIYPADESKIVELADGSWMVNSRLNSGGLRYVHLSKDEGRTWSSRPDSNLIDPGCNAGFIRYSLKNNGADKNRLIF